MSYRYYICLISFVFCVGAAFGNAASPLVSTDLLNKAGLDQLWQAQLAVKADENVQNIYLLGDTVYALTCDNYLFGITKDSGNVVFGLQLATEGFPIIEPRLGENELLVAAASDVMRINPVRGTVIDTYKFGQTIIAPVVRNKANLYIAAADKRIHAISAKDKVHIYNAGADNGSTPVTVQATDEQVVFTTDKGNVICMLPQIPKLIWQFDTAGPVTGLPVRDNNDIYIASWDTKLYKLSSVTGLPQWKAALGGILKSSPRVTASAVYQRVDDKGLTAVDKKTGKQLWTLDGGTELLAEIGQKAYIMRCDRTVAVVDMAGGKQLFTINFAQTTLEAANTADARIYVADCQGRINCITAAK